ncbi:F-box/kelch-repeat protein [Arabidopsis thaliana]
MEYGEEPPIKRTRRRFLMLPDDLVLNCLARVSRLHYPTLSLVSKKFPSLLASTELYQTRILLGLTESCLYACLRLRTDSELLHWFILCHRPHSSKNVLVPISSPSFTSPSLPGVVVVGPDIYAIGGGSKNKNASIYATGSKTYNALSSVMIMNSRSHTWHEAPSMRVGRVLRQSRYNELDGDFDTKTQTWEFLQIPNEEICKGSEYLSVSYQGTVYVKSDEKDVTYKMHKGKWREADICMNNGWSLSSSSSYCVVENVFYRYCEGEIRWYDLKNRARTILKGLGRLPSLPTSHANVKLADHGGKMAISWEEYVFVDREKKIWCAEIAIEKHQNGEIWGTLEWFDNVFISKTPNGYVGLVHALTATVW